MHEEHRSLDRGRRRDCPPVTIAQEHKIVQGRRMRVDTTVVETNIHYPTDASLLGDGVRVFTRTMKKVERLTAAARSCAIA